MKPPFNPDDFWRYMNTIFFALIFVLASGASGYLIFSML